MNWIVFVYFIIIIKRHRKREREDGFSSTIFFIVVLFIYAHDFKYKILMTMAGDYAKIQFFVLFNVTQMLRF